jgi:hypothetical protein
LKIEHFQLPIFNSPLLDPIPMPKAPPLSEAAALHFAAGCLDTQDVPVGIHDLAKCKVVITFPAVAAVERGQGSQGDGTDAYTPASKSLPLAAALFYIADCTSLSGPIAREIWMRWIRRAMEPGVKVEDLMPAEAREALDQVYAEDGHLAATTTRKTPARRVNCKGATVEVKPYTPRK